MKHFHNSTNEPASTSRVYEETNKKQDQMILDFFRKHTRARGWTSFELEAHFPRMMFTSIRRAISDNAKHLKCIGLRMGGRKRSVLVWRVKRIGK